MTSTDAQIVNNYQIFEEVELNNFPVAIQEALQDCERAHDLLLTMRNELEDTAVDPNSAENNYLNVGLHVNDALQSSIRSIGYGGSLVNRLRRMLNDEQRNEIAGDIHNMQREVVKTYASCQAADQMLWRSLRQVVQQDSVLHDDPIAIQCVDTIEDNANQLQILSSTSESIYERSMMMESMRSQLSLLEERTEQVNPRGPLSKALKIFRKALRTMNHMLHSVIMALQYRFVF